MFCSTLLQKLTFDLYALFSTQYFHLFGIIADALFQLAF